MPKRLLAVFVACSISAVWSSPATAGSCEAGKLRSLAHAASDLIRCRVHATAHGIAVDPACTSGIDPLLEADFAAAQTAGDCAVDGDFEDVRAALHAFDLELADLLVASAEPDRCAAGKLLAAATRTRRGLACRRKPSSIATCLPPAQLALTRAFERRENRGDCATTGDATFVETLAGNFVDFVASRVNGGATLPAPSELAAVVGGGSIDLTWLAPDPGTGYSQARLLRRLNQDPAGPDDPAATLVFAGAAEAAADDLTALLPNTTATPRAYHYAVYGCDIDSNCETVGSHTTLTPTVKQALQAGGYVLHWRHASADVCSDSTSLGTAQTTAVPDWWKTCDSNCGTSTARQLNDAGRAESVAIGDAFATLGIVVGRVRTSEFCRNRETAALMDFGPVPEESQQLTYFVYDEASRCSNTFAMFAEAPAAGTNTALIGHSGNTCLPLSTLAWAEAAIYKPDGIGGSTFIDRVTAAAWLSLP